MSKLPGRNYCAGREKLINRFSRGAGEASGSSKPAPHFTGEDASPRREETHRPDIRVGNDRTEGKVFAVRGRFQRHNAPIRLEELLAVPGEIEMDNGGSTGRKAGEEQALAIQI